MNQTAHKEMLAEVERDLAVLAEKMQRLQAVAEYHANKLGIEAKLPQTQSATTKQTALPKNNRFKAMNQREAAATVLSEATAPMRAPEIAKIIVAGGFPAPAKMQKLANALFTTMTRDPKRFKKVGTGLWALSEAQEQGSAA